MKKIAILQSNYIPWKGYFDIIRRVDEFIFYDEVQYTKNDWRNRNRIKTAQGVQWITIPVRHEHLSQTISVTRVSRRTTGPKRTGKAFRSITAGLLFLSHTKMFLKNYSGTRTTSLIEINRSAIELINSVLGIKTKLSSSTDYGLTLGKNERVVDLVKKAGGDLYLSGPSAKEYIDERLFWDAGIGIEWMDYSGYAEYPQLFPPFEHAVSIIDLIFNTGPDALNYLVRK